MKNRIFIKYGLTIIFAIVAMTVLLLYCLKINGRPLLLVFLESMF